MSNGTGNEIDTIIDILGGVFEGPAAGIRLARLHVEEETLFHNPTGRGIRGTDAFGSGAFGARRAGGARTHNGTDYSATPGQDVRAVISGEITRYGWPYRDDPSIRSIDVSNAQGYVVRHFYVLISANLREGSRVMGGDVIGRAQSLANRYPGITEHVHIEIRHNGNLIDPTRLIR